MNTTSQDIQDPNDTKTNHGRNVLNERSNDLFDPSDATNYLKADGSIDWSRALRDNEPWIRSTIALRVGEREPVDEVFQNVALAVIKQTAPLKDPKKLGSWLYKIAIIQSALYCRTLGRKRQLLKKFQESEQFSEADHTLLDPLNWLIQTERKEIVQNAVMKLPQEEQTMLRLKYHDDMSYQEIAEKLGLTVSAVQSKLHRARVRLKHSLASLARQD